MAMRRMQPAARGFTYLMLLWWVAIGGVMLSALGQSWSMESRRAREAELQFRGEQIRQAIEAYARVPLQEGASRWPMRLEDLLEDRRSGSLRRHLRRLWLDPITGSAEWGVIREGGREEGGILGVFSRSEQRPVSAPTGVQTYAQWQFVAGAR
ncbi:MAG: type II secretion system protein [Aquabacterium sp.]